MSDSSDTQMNDGTGRDAATVDVEWRVCPHCGKATLWRWSCSACVGATESVGEPEWDPLEYRMGLAVEKYFAADDAETGATV